MRKRLIAVLALGALLAVASVGIAAAYKPTTVIVGNIKLVLNGGFSPTKLPKNKLAPIHLKVEGAISTLDGTHPPALNKVVVETDKNGTINAKGLPTCTVGKLVATETKVALKKCKSSLVGEGKTDVELLLPEGKPTPLHSTLLAFNGGVKGGTTTILIHAFLSNPVTAAVITTVKVSKVHNGPYGTKSIATIPVISGGYGSVTKFQLEFHKIFTFRGKKQSYLLAKCPNGKLRAKAESFFTGSSTPLIGNFSRPCTPKG